MVQVDHTVRPPAHLGVVGDHTQGVRLRVEPTARPSLPAREAPTMAEESSASAAQSPWRVELSGQLVSKNVIASAYPAFKKEPPGSCGSAFLDATPGCW